MLITITPAKRTTNCHTVGSFIVLTQNPHMAHTTRDQMNFLVNMYVILNDRNLVLTD